ncbi:hypothetical protein [Chitinophaga rhizophila]|uniref:PH domain-containing protein n=1 Tax=Chitinophaga rhizophila TaxID=2866212 RepID=A0ABS7G5H5_9BACT|nr:hypothetical protein [Chitinophaga rhizophila]MBW8682884.1 hypothetical protein [Chitinophaga rhizophila]
MSLTKTRWKIESDRIVIQPNRLMFILGAVFAVLLVGLIIAFRISGQRYAVNDVYIAGFLVFAVGIFILSGFTYIVFDRANNRMKKMLFGVVPVKSIPFDKLQGVNIVTQGAGSYSFRIFTKASKYGRGTIISSGYSKDTDANAIAFNNEVIPLIHQYLDAADPLPEEKEVMITDYEYFTSDGGIYTLKANNIFLAVMGISLLALGIHECTPAAWMTSMSTVGRVSITGACLLFGLIFIAAAFTKITFNTGTRMIERKSPIKLGNHQFPFEHFVSFQTVRNTYNGIYSGTQVLMFFYKPGDKREKTLQLHSFRNTRKIERLLTEVKSIMK